MLGFEVGNYMWFWVPVVGPHVGAIVGAVVYEVAVGLHWPTDDELQKDSPDGKGPKSEGIMNEALVGKLENNVHLMSLRIIGNCHGGTPAAVTSCERTPGGRNLCSFATRQVNRVQGPGEDETALLLQPPHPSSAERVPGRTSGDFLLMVIGIGVIAQATLSEFTFGSDMSIFLGWGLAVAIGISSCVGVTDALDNYDGGVRQVDGSKATAGIWATYPKEYVSVWTGFGDQILATALLMVGVMALTDIRHSNGKNSHLVPFFAGGLVAALCMAFGLNCGCPLNPARDLAPRIFTSIAGWGIKPFSFRNYSWFWVPVVAPHVGAILGAFIYQYAVGLHWPPDNVDSPLKLSETNINPDNSLQAGNNSQQVVPAATAEQSSSAD
ncbi:hypothetical protein C0Q70_20457 [Pomacea canaliculata]|uniref:Aquaporin-3 n=1 Tax=Pomacea canaliculata TaxID=400727 RepID=A0A2T7NFL0_POMCA|nr:hypothetical protein C0Q70_20457 [Pomacea canaliculata]